MRPVAPALIGAMLCCGCSAQVGDGTTFLAGGSPVGEFGVAVRSMNDVKFDAVIKQQYDFSCGSAALATLLRFHYGFDVTEEQAFRGMWARGDRDQIRRVGFSLLDMKRWLGSRGLSADGYEVGLDRIAETGLPGIALISVKNYKHFVVVKGVRNGEVLIGDPSAGLTVIPREDFVDSWNGVYFVLSDDRDRARAAFDADRQWASYVRAPVSAGFSDPVSQQALMLSAPFYGDF